MYLFFILIISAIFEHVGAQRNSPSQQPTQPIYGDSIDSVGLSPTAAQAVMGALIFAIFVGMLSSFQSPEVLFLGAVCVALVLQIITLSDALSGFSNPSMITIGALFVVVGGVERSHIVDWAVRKTFGSGSSLFMGKLRMFCVCFMLSIFFYNTPLVAILLPIVKDWARVRNIAASQLLIPLSYSVMAGGSVTMIGAATNLTIQGLVEADRGFTFGFFDPAPFGLALFPILLFYQLFCGPILLPKEQFGLLRTAREKADSLIAEVYVSPESSAVGKSVGDMLKALGLSPGTVIKIRRQLQPSRPMLFGDCNGACERRRSSLLDWNYLKNNARNWAKGTIPNRAMKSRTLVNSAAEAAILQHGSNKSASQYDNSKDYVDIIVPQVHELIAAHDVVFLSSAQDVVEKMMKSIAGESAGLYILNSNALALPGYGTELLECVVSHQNPFLGKRVEDVIPLFAEKYNAGIITVRGKDWDKPQEPPRPAPLNVPNQLPETNADTVEQHRPFAESFINSGRIYCGQNLISQTEGLNGNEDSRCDVGADGKYSPVESYLKSDILSDENLHGSGEWKIDIKENGVDNTSWTGAGGDDHVQVHANENMEVRESEFEFDAGTASNNGSVFSKLDPDVIKQTSIKDHILDYGDLILCVSNEKEINQFRESRDFFVVSTIGSIPQPPDIYKLIPVIMFVVMVGLVAGEIITLPAASLIVAFIIFIGKWVDATEIPRIIDFRLLMLIALSISFATAVTKSGLATSIANVVSHVQGGPQSAIILVYALALACTELISNNASAALMYPIAVALADSLQVSYKPFVMVVLISCTSGFMSPISYQTHLMVWGPGGYKFTDFLKFGLIPDVVYWFGASLLVPLVFPF